MPYIIGIAGGSGSGKTTIARAIMTAVPARQAVLLEHDNYYKDLAHLPEDKRLEFNFDHPDSLESSLLAEHLKLLKQGAAIEEPTYDFVHHVREPATIPIQPKPVIVVEGILTLASPELLPFFDLKIFVDTDSDIRFIRRLSRDINERGRTMENVISQYLKTVRPMHLEFVEPSKRLANVILPEGGENQAALDLVLAKVRSVV